MRVPGCGRRERCEANVELGVCDFDAESGEGVQVCGLGGKGARFADDEVALQTDAVDFDAARFEGFDEVLGGGGFGAAVFNIVVVVVEFHAGVVKRRGFEGNGDVFGSDLRV